MLLEGTALRKVLAFQVTKKRHIGKKIIISTRNTVSCFVFSVFTVLGLYVFYKKLLNKHSCPGLYPYRRPNLLPGFWLPLNKPVKYLIPLCLLDQKLAPLIFSCLKQNFVWYIPVILCFSVPTLLDFLWWIFISHCNMRPNTTQSRKCTQRQNSLITKVMAPMDSGQLS